MPNGLEGSILSNIFYSLNLYSRNISGAHTTIIKNFRPLIG